VVGKRFSIGIPSIFRSIAIEPTGTRDTRPRMLPVTPRRRRARPVADAPIEALLPHSEQLAKGWLLALLEQAPLDDAPAILAADLTREGPRLCDAVLRAIANDTDLSRLQPGGALTPLAARAGALAGATAPAAVSGAIDALQGVIWTAVRDELRHPDPDLISELTERLTLITELLRTAALEQIEPWPPSVAASAPLAPPPVEPSPPPAPPPFEPSPPLAPPPFPFEPPPLESSRPPAAAGHPVRSSVPRSWPGFSDVVGAEPPDALWVGGLEDEIMRSAGSSLSLLLAELDDAERVSAVAPQLEASATFEQFAGAVRSAVRRQDILVCESGARAWIIARDTARLGAHALGERIAAAVRDSGPWQGAPLTASIGVAVLGEDGLTSAELIEAAEEARFAAAASGVEVLAPEPRGRG
jgi:GGDEF domain-containing protein